MAVSVIACVTGKNIKKIGSKIVPKPNPEKKVSKDATKEIMQMTYIIFCYKFPTLYCKPFIS